MNTETFTRTTVETVKGHQLTEANFYETAREIRLTEGVMSVDITLGKDGDPRMTVTVLKTSLRDTFAVGDIITVQHGAFVKPYPSKQVGSWEAEA